MRGDSKGAWKRYKFILSYMSDQQAPNNDELYFQFFLLLFVRMRSLLGKHTSAQSLFQCQSCACFVTKILIGILGKSFSCSHSSHLQQFSDHKVTGYAVQSKGILENWCQYQVFLLWLLFKSRIMLVMPLQIFADRSLCSRCSFTTELVQKFGTFSFFYLSVCLLCICSYI